jgi:hypothetical protein
MSTDAIKILIQQIRDVSGDDESAHGMEDNLRTQFLAYVATDPNDDDLGEKAKLILSTNEIEFERWCA